MNQSVLKNTCIHRALLVCCGQVHVPGPASGQEGYTVEQSRESEFLSVGAVAERLGLSASGIRKLEKAGVLPASQRLQDGRRFWPAGDVDLMRTRIAERRAARREAVTAA